MRGHPRASPAPYSPVQPGTPRYSPAHLSPARHSADRLGHAAVQRGGVPALWGSVRAVPAGHGPGAGEPAGRAAEHLHPGVSGQVRALGQSREASPGTVSPASIILFPGQHHWSPASIAGGSSGASGQLWPGAGCEGGTREQLGASGTLLHHLLGWDGVACGLAKTQMQGLCCLRARRKQSSVAGAACVPLGCKCSKRQSCLSRHRSCISPDPSISPQPRWDVPRLQGPRSSRPGTASSASCLPCFTPLTPVALAPVQCHCC